MSLKKTKIILFLLIGITLVVAVVNLSLFSFRLTEDSACWITVATFFKEGGKGIAKVSQHCLLNPLIPLVASAVSTIFIISIKDAYLIINVLALFLTAVLLFNIGKSLTNTTFGLLAALLFLVDFQTQYFAFAVMPDVVTWLFTLLFIYFLIQTAGRKDTSTKQIVSLGILGAAATLSKMNLGFLILLIPAVLFRYQKKKWFNKSLIFLLSAFIPIVSFYFWVIYSKGAFPWSSLALGIQRQSPSLKLHLTTFISAFLYTLPFIIIGLKINPFKAKYRDLLLLILVGLLAPILIWPYVLPRFTFNLFPLLFPLAASGMIYSAQFVSSKKTIRRLVLAALILVMFILATLRVHLTFTNQSHINFFYNLYLRLA